MILNTILAILIIALCIGLLQFGMKRRAEAGCCLGRAAADSEDCHLCPLNKLANSRKNRKKNPGANDMSHTLYVKKWS